MLLLDRFLATSTSVLDLATGLAVRVRRRPRSSCAPLYTRRGRWTLVDAGSAGKSFLEVWAIGLEGPTARTPSCEAIEAVLQDARDGHPRIVDLVTDTPDQWLRAVYDVARITRRSGFVPVDVGVLGQLLEGAGWRWPPWLLHRSLVVFTCDGRMTPMAARGILHLASRDARPHVVIRGATSPLQHSMYLAPLPAHVLETDPEGWEAPAPPAPSELAASAWRRADGGVHDDVTTATARWAMMLAPDSATSLTARAALARSLVSQGRVLQARAALAPALQMEDDVPAECRSQVAHAREAIARVEQPSLGDGVLTRDFLRILELCQTFEDESTALGKVLALLRERLAATALAFLVSEHDQLRVVAHVGSLSGRFDGAVEVMGGSPATVPGDHRQDGVWPVRYAGTVSGVLWGRWPAGLVVRPGDLAALMEYAASAVSPALHAAAERGRALTATGDFPDVVGHSDAMRTLRESIVRAARSPFPVLIEGESGSGKELVARAIHRLSPRRDRRFSALNCAALTDELAEAELFGHARGAFTGAVTERLGLFEEASGGTLFLDEVSELSTAVQAKLLRVLQEHEIRRLGESHVRRIDARVVAATNKPLATEVEAGRFRRDLRYRLDVVRLAIPPLRARLEDLPALVRHIWSGLCERTGSRAVLSPAALSALGRYDWPGNVRELQNVLASLMVASPPRGVVPATQLPAHVLRTTALTERGSLALARREFERRFVRAALARADGRCATAARELGVSRQGLRKLIERLGMVEPNRQGLPGSVSREPP